MKKNKKHIDFENEIVPDGFAPQSRYFDELESSVFEQLGIEEQFETEQDGFGAEQHYFEELDDKIYDAVGINQRDKTKNSAKIISIVHRKKLLIAAAGIAAIFILSILLPFNSNVKEMSFSNLTQETQEWYVGEQVLFLTDDELSTLLSDAVFDIEIEDDAVNNELESYLLENEINPYAY